MSAYEGQIAAIPLGTMGLFTDAPQSQIPSTNLIRANNVTYYDGVLEKDFGSRRWNDTAFPAGVVRFQEMFSDSQGRVQRIYVLLKNGTIYRLKDTFTQDLVAATNGAPANLNTMNYTSMVLGGNEQQNSPKKIFVYTGYDPVQVIAGDTVIRTTISKPPVDWTGTNQPFGSVLHRGAMFSFGCPNNPHQVYVSSTIDQEDYTTIPLNYTVYPGEGDVIVGGAVFRGTFFLFKYPLGVYTLIDSDPDRTKWYFTKFGDDFGGVSPNGFCVSGDDLIVANNYGGLTSMSAAFKLGDIATADIFHELGIRRYTKDQIRPDVIFTRDMIFYGYKRQYFAAFQSYQNPYPDTIFCMDIRQQQLAPKVSWNIKDQPNCLGMIRDSIRVPRPFYGASDGYIYQMDMKDRWVGPESGVQRVGYEMDAQTPHFDFSQGSPLVPTASLLGSPVKQFDFLQLEYEPTGAWDVQIDVYMDGRLNGTYSITVKGRSNLDEFPLTNSVVDGYVGFTERIPIPGEGKRISLRFRNNVLGQNIRLVKAYIFYRVSGDQEAVE